MRKGRRGSGGLAWFRGGLIFAYCETREPWRPCAVLARRCGVAAGARCPLRALHEFTTMYTCSQRVNSSTLKQWESSILQYLRMHFIMYL